MRRKQSKLPPNQVVGGDSFFKPKVQTKLAMGTPGDKYEVEADRMADQVVNKTGKGDAVQKMEGEEEVQQKPLAASVTPLVQKMEASEEESPVQKMQEEEPVQAMEEEEPIQKMQEEEPVQAMEEEEPVQKMKEEESVQAMEEEEPVQKMEEEEPVQAMEEEEPVQKMEEEEPVQAMEEEEPVQTKQGDPTTANSNIEKKLRKGNGGSKMDADTKTEMESGFGADFSNVNIHKDSEATEMSQNIGAQAFTHGNDVYFNNGKYDPNSKEGKHLLAHELTHTIQQKGMVQKKVQKQEDKPVGKFCDYKDTYNVAFYDENTGETKRRAKEWAKNFNAIGLSKGKIKENTAIPDSNSIASTLTKISAQISADCSPEEGKKPKVKNLAIFAHGTDDWCGIGSNITSRNAKKVVKSLIPNIANDVNIILYACNVARGPDEKEDWKKGTLKGGGKDSLSDRISDELHKNDIKKAKVWGHTTTGHTTRNFALRLFSSTNVKNIGQSYLSNYVFTPYDLYLIKEKVVTILKDEGYDITSLDKSHSGVLNKIMDPFFYTAYRKANKSEKYKGMNLAEAAPVYPGEVAKVINQYWDKTYWPSNKSKILKKIIKKLNIKKEAD